MAEITPMMKQYLEIKEQNKDSILFFRLGDFYEMFNEDAQLASRELDLTLTTRDRGKAAEDQTPMCGIPYHSSDAYIARLIAKGYKVAICEQTEDPALAQGPVKRAIIRVTTPRPGAPVHRPAACRATVGYWMCLCMSTHTGPSPSCGCTSTELKKSILLKRRARSERITTGNSRPFDLWIDMMRPPVEACAVCIEPARKISPPMIEGSIS